MRCSPCRLRGGELSEWPKEPDSKSGVPVRVPWVRIPRSPPLLVVVGFTIVDGAAPADQGGGRVLVEDHRLAGVRERLERGHGVHRPAVDRLECEGRRRAYVGD